jgi:glycosyltransferase involved in cell wall biosynthesis
MRIAMFTNTYLPHVGGVARAVDTLAKECSRMGHEVRIIAPDFNGAEEAANVLRTPAIQNFNGSDFSVQLPVPNLVRDFMDDFKPDIIHSHHPFLLGDTALREAWKSHVPILFTHHTLYECYTHYVPLDSPALKRVVIQLATEYCNLCDRVIAPSQSIADLLVKRGVSKEIRANPTGIDLGFFASGNGGRFRKEIGIAADAAVIGHVGRLAKEKNLLFLAESVALAMEAHPHAVFLVVGNGDAKAEILELLHARVEETRVIATGLLTGQTLADAYAAMDWFAFASQSETQGLVLAEAMAAGKPVVALDGPGVREIVSHCENGYLLDGEADPTAFAEALGRLISNRTESERLHASALATAVSYGTRACVARILVSYHELIDRKLPMVETDTTLWDRMMENMRIEWNLLMEKMSAAAAVVETPASGEVKLD